MEGGLTCRAASQSTITPLCVSNHRLISRQFSLPITGFTDGNTTSATKGRKPICVKALKSSSTARLSLSSNWDVAPSASASASIAVPTSSRMPTLEELDTTNMLLRQRIVFLGSRLNAVTADFIISQLLFLNAEDSEQDIKLFINSSGGSVTAAMGIYDAIKLCKADVSTICVGLAASMSAFLLAAGTKGKRYCMPNGRVMLHRPLGKARGNLTEKLIRVKELNYHSVKVKKMLSRFTGKSVEQIEDDTAREYYMNAWEAKEYGLIDAVIDDGKPGLVAPRVDCSPPPKSAVPDIWKAEGSSKNDSLPSEHKFLLNGYAGGEGNKDTERDKEKE